MSIRSRISRLSSGGPRQFVEKRGRYIISIAENSSQEVVEELNSIGMSVKELDNSPVIIAEPLNNINSIMSDITDIDVTEEISNSADTVLNIIRSIDSVIDVNRVYTQVDYGPENLRLSPFSMDTVTPNSDDTDISTLSDINSKYDISEVWEYTRGENSIVAIFDTGFSSNIVSDDRVIETYSGDNIESVYAPEEGHGTMTLASACADESSGLPYSAPSPDSDVILVRITDERGQISSDIIASAWDWLTNLDYDRPIINNHSYGIPICSSRPQTKYCNDGLARVIREANSRDGITSVYAAGNEAMYCGHRVSGITNGITGHNSLSEIITVGALRDSEDEVQRYSSHGKGDCSPTSDPKPNITTRIPQATYYGVPESSNSRGWAIKDMSIGIGGSAAGTSHAAPYTAGLISLIQSHSMEVNGEPMNNRRIKGLLKDYSDPPRRTQSNIFSLRGPKGYDARFGWGELDILSLIEDI
jgi:subtilisin family serine protease